MYDKRDMLVKIMLSINLTQHAHIISIISQLNIILTQHVDNPSNTCEMPRIEIHNPIQS